MPRAWQDPTVQTMLRGSLGAAAQRAAKAQTELDDARTELNALIVEAADGNEAPHSAIVEILADNGLELTRGRVGQIVTAGRG